MAQFIDAATLVALLTVTVFLIYFLFVLRDIRILAHEGKALAEKLRHTLDRLQPTVEETLSQAQQFFRRSDELIDRIEKDLVQMEEVFEETRRIQKSLQELNTVLQKNIISPIREIGLLINAATKAAKAFFQFLFRPKS